MPSNTITGVGSALVDVLINETDEFLQKISKEKVSMTYVTADEQQAIIAASSQRPVIVPGGAACNTILGVGNLGGAARFIGARGKDEYGDILKTLSGSPGWNLYSVTSTPPRARSYPL